MRYSSVKEGAAATPDGQIFTVEYPDERALFYWWEDHGDVWGIICAATSPYLLRELKFADPLTIDFFETLGLGAAITPGHWIFAGTILEHVVCTENGDVTYSGRTVEGKLVRANPSNTDVFFQDA